MAETNDKFNCYGAIAEAIDKELNRFITPEIYGCIDTSDIDSSYAERKERFPHKLFIMQVQAEVLRAFVNEYIDTKIACGDMLADMVMNKADGKDYMDKNIERLKSKLGKDEIDFR